MPANITPNENEIPLNSLEHECPPKSSKGFRSPMASSTPRYLPERSRTRSSPIRKRMTKVHRRFFNKRDYSTELEDN